MCRRHVGLLTTDLVLGRPERRVHFLDDFVRPCRGKVDFVQNREHLQVLIDRVGAIVQHGTGSNPASYINDGELTTVCNEIVEGYRRIVAVRDVPNGLNNSVPIFLHTYDRVTPRDAPSRAGVIPVAGPWLIDTLEECEIRDHGLQRAIVDQVFERLTATLLSLQMQLPNFHVVATTGTLTQADSGTTGNSRDWLNEIHPNRGGYKKIAAKIATALQGV